MDRAQQQHFAQQDSSTARIHKFVQDVIEEVCEALEPRTAVGNPEALISTTLDDSSGCCALPASDLEALCDDIIHRAAELAAEIMIAKKTRTGPGDSVC